MVGGLQGWQRWGLQVMGSAFAGVMRKTVCVGPEGQGRTAERQTDNKG